MAAPRAAHHSPDGRFRNPWPGTPQTGFRGLLKWVLVHRTTNPPPRDPPRDHFERRRVEPKHTIPRHAPDRVALTWIGHSTWLIQIGGCNVLTDPVWSDRASPFRHVGPRRWVAPGIPFEALPPIDVVCQSHDHYDHLDRSTVRRLASRWPGATWLAPLGVASLLRRFGAGDVRELDWWEEVTAGPLHAAAVPARHFSGRGMNDRGRRLWCGWSLNAGGRRVLFAGDTALHPEMATVANRFGPFDAVLLPIGAYEPRWFMRPVHMDPDEAVQAWKQLGTGATVPPLMAGMHWGTFKLADEAMDEPPRRVRDAWGRERLPEEKLWVPAHGETREL